MSDIFSFPSGESHCKFRDRSQLIKDGTTFIETFLGGAINNGLIETFLVTDVLKRRGNEIVLYLPFFPYSRQDRPTSEEESFSLKVVGDLLNSQGYKNVITLDVHSDVAFGCVHNLQNISVGDILRICQQENRILQNLSERILIVPDQGAFKRLNKISDQFKSIAISIKTRDEATGFLILKELIGSVEGEDCLIIDDICDGGGTFIHLAQELKKRGAKSIELFVTHGFFTKGLLPLKEAGIDHVYTTTSVIHQNWLRDDIENSASQLEGFLTYTHIVYKTLEKYELVRELPLRRVVSFGDKNV